MSDGESFADLLKRVRGGDGQAAAELVRRYEPLLRREVRVHLNDPSLNRLLDSVDICQSVLASFFVRTAAGQYDLSEPAQLVALLFAMARNKLAYAARKERARCRDARRRASATVDEIDPVGDEPCPSRVAAGRDLLAEVRRRLSEDEQRLAERRAAGQEWAAIAADLGGTPEGRRKQLARALDRVSCELGLDDHLVGAGSS
jgi:RNA polymerase sigma-70 factor (ECF subfamily)